MKHLSASLLGAVAVVLACAAGARAEPLRLGSTGAVAVLLQHLADAYAARTPQDQVEVVPGLGSGGAIAAVTAGALDVAISSREINDKERAQGGMSTPMLETPYLFVSAISAPLSLTQADILGYYAGTTRAYPNGEPVRLVLRPRSDANTVYITSAIPGMSAAQEQARLRHDIPVAGTDQDNMAHMKSIPGAFSGMSLTQLSMEPNSLQRVRIAGVEGTLETMKNGTYPYRITMFSVTGKTASASARRFQAFLASAEARAIVEKAGARPLIP